MIKPHCPHRRRCPVPSRLGRFRRRRRRTRPYVRLAPPGRRPRRPSWSWKNAGDKPASLVRVDNGVAKVTELHNHTNDDGVMRMRQVKAVEVPAKGEVKLEPGGLHVVLIDLKTPPQGGARRFTLGFADGSSKTVDAKVVRPGASGEGQHHHH